MGEDGRRTRTELWSNSRGASLEVEIKNCPSNSRQKSKEKNEKRKFPNKTGKKLQRKREGNSQRGY